MTNGKNSFLQVVKLPNVRGRVRYISDSKRQENLYATFIIIEHNIKFIAEAADYIIDFGLFGGEAGGIVAAQGVPEFVFSQETSSLYKLDKIVI